MKIIQNSREKCKIENKGSSSSNHGLQFLVISFQMFSNPVHTYTYFLQNPQME